MNGHIVIISHLTSCFSWRLWIVQNLLRNCMLESIGKNFPCILYTTRSCSCQSDMLRLIRKQVDIFNQNYFVFLYVKHTSKLPADMRLKFISIIILKSLIWIMNQSFCAECLLVSSLFSLTLIISAHLLSYRHWYISMSIFASYSIASFVHDSWSLESCPRWLDISKGWQIMWIISLTQNLCLLSCFFILKPLKFFV